MSFLSQTAAPVSDRSLSRRPAEPRGSAEPRVTSGDERQALTDSIFGDDEELTGILTILEAASLHACDALLDPDAGDATPWVLCIDDDPVYTAGLRRHFEAAGISMVAASSGMEGFQMAFRHPASAIVLDFNMPNGQGDYVLHRLKRNPATSDIPVIVITGNRDRMLRRRMLSLGAAAFLTKPVEFDELLANVRRHLAPVGHEGVDVC